MELMESYENLERKKIWGKIWFGFYIVFLLFMVQFTLIIILLRQMWIYVNPFINSEINLEINWLVMILVFTFLLLGYSIYLFVFHLIELVKQKQTHPHLANKIIPCPFLIIWIIMYIVLLLEGGSEFYLIRVQLEYVSPLFWLVVFYCVSFLCVIASNRINELWKKAKRSREKFTNFWNDKNKAIIYVVIILVVFSSVFFLPLITKPSNVYWSTNLPEKPQLIAHRGASHLAPENTIAAGELAVKWNAVGWEVDVTISFDGVLFLMHDNTLERTTNVKEIFPSRAKDHVTNFTISELKQLDAGSWFNEQDPYRTITKGYVTQVELDSYIDEKIPTLEEVINFTRNNDLLLDVDYRYPPSSHPFYGNYMDILLTQLNASGLGKKILMNSYEPLAENMTHICVSGDIPDLLSQGCELINTNHGIFNYEFREYEESGLDVMVWTVDTKARFSQLWCLGVDYVKTNAIHLLSEVKKPIWSMSVITYLYIWVGIYCSLIPLLVIVALLKDRPKWKKKSKKKSKNNLES